MDGVFFSPASIWPCGPTTLPYVCLLSVCRWIDLHFASRLCWQYLIIYRAIDCEDIHTLFCVACLHVLCFPSHPFAGRRRGEATFCEDVYTHARGGKLVVTQFGPWLVYFGFGEGSMLSSGMIVVVVAIVQ